MRTWTVFALVTLLAPSGVLAQASGDEATPDQALDPDNYGVLSADQRAQLSLGGFRDYVDRLEADDAQLFQLLDARLDGLEERNVIADVLFWTGTVLSVGALVGAIPVYDQVGEDAGIGMIIGGASAFLLTVIIQAVIRPGHDDLMELIDLHDQRLGRR